MKRAEAELFASHTQEKFGTTDVNSKKAMKIPFRKTHYKKVEANTKTQAI